MGIGASKFVLSTIFQGYKIPFVYTPPSVDLRNNKSALENSDFVCNAISDLVKVGSVLECEGPLYVVNPLSVSVQPNGKKRLILDLRHVNVFVKKAKIKFEDARYMLTVLLQSTCFWAVSFDIKSGYHHMEIFEADQCFLGFSWEFSGVRKYFKFTVLPFGLSTGPYIFSKVIRPLVKHWRSQALKIVVYLDNGFCVITGRPSCQECSECSVKLDLENSGFVANKDKCQWLPTQFIRWLGYNWDFESQTVAIPQDKIDKVKFAIQNTLHRSRLSAREIACVTGLVISNSLVFGPVCKLITKSLHRLIEQRVSWESSLSLDKDCKSELEFWDLHIEDLNLKSLTKIVDIPSRIVYSDSSSLGCASVLQVNGMPFSPKKWDKVEII